MKIEAGKFYKTRDGRKIGPMRDVTSCGWVDWVKFVAEAEGDTEGWGANGNFYRSEPSQLDLIAEWTDEPRPWGELTDAEKGALLLAEENGKLVEVWHKDRGEWGPPLNTGLRKRPWTAYRVKPEPVVETVTVYGLSDPGGWTFGAVNMGDTHRITFTTKDGEPATGTFTNENGDVIKMERI